MKLNISLSEAGTKAKLIDPKERVSSLQYKHGDWLRKLPEKANGKNPKYLPCAFKAV
jgi:hypothetical protein